MTDTAVRLLALALCSFAVATAPAAQAAPKHKPKGAIKKVVKKTDYVGEQVNFGEWRAVNGFVDEMVARHGFAREDLLALLAQVRYMESAIGLVKPAPPGKPKNWQAYRQLTIEPVRIGAGVQFWDANAEVLAQAEALYGVPAEIIVGIIGVETVYGRNTGRFRIVDVLTTLAFAYPDTPNRAARMTFFRGELANTLLLARQSGIDPLSLLGSFAGAVGMPQFMPGSIMAWGVDFDSDGVVDLRNSAADAIGSVANFLVHHGWQAAETGPLVYGATVSPNHAWEKFIGRGLAATLHEEELLAAGVSSEQVLPSEMAFGLIDLQNGAEATEYWLANDNFFAITHYNRSYFYAMAVIELGRAVRLARAAQ